MACRKGFKIESAHYGVLSACYSVLIGNMLSIRVKMKFEKRLLTSVDVTTGEQLEGMAVLIPPKSSPYDRDKWFPVSQGALEQIATDKEIKGQTYRVLMFLLSQMDYENWITIHQPNVAERLGVARQRVTEGIKALLKKEILIRGEKVGKAYKYRLNPYFAWKGNKKTFIEALEETDKVLG